MTTEQPKTATTITPEHPSPAPTSAPVQLPPFNGAFPHLPTGYPPFFAYPPPADGQQAEGSGPVQLPYPLLYPPPGMVYAFPPQSTPAVAPQTPTSSRPKRRQVKMACTNCAAACKRCDEARPCERCKKYGMAESCADGQRKERKKGIKRGPYKRKNKSPDDNLDYASQSPSEGGEWNRGSPQPPPPPQNAASTSAAVPVAQFPPPEGFYPIYIPPGYPLPEPPGNTEGSAPSGPPTIVPFYIGGFTPYGYPPGAIFQLPPLGTHPPPPPASQPQTAEAGTVSTSDKNSEEAASAITQNDSQTGTPRSAIPEDMDGKDIHAGETNIKTASAGNGAVIEHDKTTTAKPST